MRPLKRPMFKYGGDVKKQGIMHGMNGLRDGGVATTMADATGYAGGGMTMPDMRGRVTGPGGYSGKKKKSFFKPTLGGVTGSVGLDAYLDPAPYMSLLQAIGAFKDGGSVGPGLVGDPRYPQQGGRAMHSEKLDYFKNIYKAGAPIVKNFFTPKKYLKKGKAIQKIAGKVPGMLQSAVQQAGPGIMSTRQALMKNLKDFNVPYGSKIKDFAVAAGQKALKYPKTSAAGALGLTSDTAMDVYGAIGGAGKSIAENLTPGWLQRLFTPTPKKAPPPGEGGTGGVPDVGMNKIKPKKSQAEIDAEIKANEEDKLKKIYSLLGVDRAKRGAASKALADMSRYIDEGGKDTISRKNIGSTLTKGILAFDKRLDKVDQLKEAAGLMQAKGMIEKDIRSTDNELKELTKQKIRNELTKKFADLKMVSKIPGQKGYNTAAATASEDYRGNLITQTDLSDMIEKVKDKEGILDETVIIENITNETIKDKNIADGDYTVGDSLVTIEKGKVTAVLR